MDETTFRTDFPEFQSTATYPSTGVTFWLGIAANVVNSDAWGALSDLGVALFTAHNLVLEQQAQKAATAGGAPGAGQVGPIASKSIDKVSVSYDLSKALLEGGGDLNLTTFGSRFYRLSLMMGAGGLQVC